MILQLLHLLLCRSAVVQQFPILSLDSPKSSYFQTKILQHVDNRCEQLSPIELTQPHSGVTSKDPVFVKIQSVVRSETIQVVDDDTKLIEIISKDQNLIIDKMLKICNSIEWYDDLETLSADAEVIPISISGDPVNRIDVVFMGDGYTSAERERFIADITRLYKDMWSSVTFESYLPLFNIWAVFVPSNESGIGSGGKPKDTAFGLYRDGTELRGIYTTKRSFARKVCKVTGEFACDYPSLIGNDEYYGGLGGEFVISTRSKTSGTVVLRHEMGHKYDGGQVYSGVNAVKSLEKIPWKEWLTEPNHIREEKEILLVQDYSWYDLGKGPYVIDFKSDGKYDRWSLQISSSGVEQDGSLEVYLDGRQLEWKSSGILDRTFSHWDGETGLAAGPHKLVFKQGFPPSGKDSPIRQLCSVSLHEFANQSLFQSDPNFIGAFPTFDLYGRKTYRPTNDACLMRNMSRNRFCTVCQEGLWLNLLTRISFIDKLEQTCEGGLAKISLKPLPVAQFRKLSLSYVNETLHVRWYKQGVHQQDFDDNFDLELPKATVGEKWKVTVDFKSSEIRKETKLTHSEWDFAICQ